MSIWTEVVGTVCFHESKHISLKKVVEDHFFTGEGSLTIVSSTKLSDGYYEIEFTLSFCDSGDSAWKTWKSIKKTLHDLAGNPLPNGRCTVVATLIVRDGI